MLAAVTIQALQDVKNQPTGMVYADRRAFQRFQDCYDKSEIYYAYELIHRSSSEAFCSIYPGVHPLLRPWIHFPVLICLHRCLCSCLCSHVPSIQNLDA